MIRIKWIINIFTICILLQANDAIIGKDNSQKKKVVNLEYDD